MVLEERQWALRTIEGFGEAVESLGEDVEGSGRAVEGSELEG